MFVEDGDGDAVIVGDDNAVLVVLVLVWCFVLTIMMGFADNSNDDDDAV